MLAQDEIPEEIQALREIVLGKPKQHVQSITTTGILGYLPAQSYTQFSKEFMEFQKRWTEYLKQTHFCEVASKFQMYGRPYRKV